MLDASAILAVILQERGGDRVIKLIDRSVVSAVNASEVYAKLTDLRFPPETIDGYFAEISPPVVSFETTLARAAGLLRSTTREVGASFSDRACLALAAARGATAVTADRAWQRLDIGIRIELIR